MLGLHLAGELILAELNRREVRRHAGAAPAAVAAIVDAPTYAKSVEYTQAKLRFGMVSQVFDTALLAAVVFGGLLPWLYAKFAPMAPAGTWDDALFIGAALVLLSIPSQPFDWWSTFRLEARFGFNKSTLQLWLGDKLKGVMLAAVIGFPLLWALLSLVLWVGRWWWLWGFALIFAFQLLMMVLYPKLILPLFNKLTPLPDGELRTRLLALADRTGFKAQTIEVIDGSKRSGHSNAYFTGFGRFRRIVLFDTLISQLTPEELEAVLAHEIGHYRRGHIPRMLAISAIIQLGALAAIAALAASGWFNPAFGFPAGEIAPAFLLFGLLSGAAMFWLTPLANLFSRKHEYEADAFAREAMGGPAPLVAALRKLAQKNLSNLTPHPWYSGFHYSHPTLVERERALTA
ncbi:MAG TPA: M48 family metallopeptidase [Opitutaceae bacterium]|nr:M48 family metallopeptidase [Opitutaceae bacterium]HPG17933.1 M48 family metallopeptidase [Opitutaceae bacterium]HQL21869.1 M48 family metallopeptidase [Opitutaceae bacterium]